MPTKDDCVFCGIVAGTSPATIVREWPDAIAFVPLNPVAPPNGHILVIPRMHVRDAVTRLDVTAATMRRAAELAAGHEASNILTSIGRAATQSVFHLHIHVIRRAVGDQLMVPWGTTGNPHDPHWCRIAHGLRERAESAERIMAEAIETANGLQRDLRTAEHERRQAVQRAEQAEAEVERLTEERDLAIAHDRQPYPTAWAYEQACKALETQRQRAEQAEAERDALEVDLTRVRAAYEVHRIAFHETPVRGCGVCALFAALDHPTDTPAAHQPKPPAHLIRCVRHSKAWSGNLEMFQDCPDCRVEPIPTHPTDTTGETETTP